MNFHEHLQTGLMALVGQHLDLCITKLSIRYGFDAEEAIAYINSSRSTSQPRMNPVVVSEPAPELDPELVPAPELDPEPEPKCKLVTEPEDPNVSSDSDKGDTLNVKELPVMAPTSKRIPLPFCGVVVDNACQGLRVNYGLYTQCDMKPVKKMDNGLSLCKTCFLNIDETTGRPKYGFIAERLESYDKRVNGGFKDPKGKCPVKYSVVMKRLGITRIQAEIEAKKMGWIIPEAEFSVSGLRKRKGPKPIVTVTYDDDDVISQLVKDAVPEEDIDDGNNDNNKQDNEEEEDEDDEDEDDVEDEDEDEEDEVEVVKFELNDKTYLKSASHVLYNLNTHDEIGSWDPRTNSVEYHSD